MPHPFVRLLISLVLVMHLFIVALAVLGHRGTSYLHDDVLSALAPYATLGNWRIDSNRVAIASTSQLSELMSVEWHERTVSADEWIKYPVVEQSKPGRESPTLSREQRFDQLWLQQISGLLVYDNDAGVGQMLSGAMKSYKQQRDDAFDKVFDKVRITVAPQLSIEQYVELKGDKNDNDLPEPLQPQVAYVASIIDMGDGQYSFIRELQGHRASKSLLPTKQSSSSGDKRP